ncbi:hypothetical protein JIN77_15560 [Verrucomicrobiaceae bacterium R5-34]|uniref:Uncharacterized protein n=1 Tax=Oceaniferula flava TaxID=2800421 RepID=A0AAE2SH42_9BACT|nr:hypothetical protein [Oceaniferula flavus]MBK1832154.1 hypothetical protein [Verrucomicrobiaceae bacterium R5-34]MBK1856266.1 hypothetical protein [Oceaniferula flavus]MBM1137573.1 hypothetical protein [Oceaniferula flavus]
MNADQTIAPVETSALVNLANEYEVPEGIYAGFVGENASYFAQAFAPLNEVFGNDGQMRIVSDEEDYTVVAAVRHAEGGDASEAGAMDVDCAILESHQDSLRDCLTALNDIEDLT